MRTVIWQKMTAANRRRALSRPAMAKSGEVTKKVRGIIADVKRRGDRALRELTKRLDGVDIRTLEVSLEEKRAAVASIAPADRAAIERAVAQVTRFHQAQLPRPIDMNVSSGLRLMRQARPIESVGLYVPGGTAPLPSTVVMLGVPAAIAQCPVRVLCTPPGKNGGIDPHILLAAELCGIERIFKVGGAQAIAAMAYGTRSIPKVDKIFGPGNRWVTEAKVQVAADGDTVAIDMPAGPSEVMVIADASARADFVAADLLSQAEHGADSQVVLVSDDERLLKAALDEVKRQLKSLPRREIAAAALKKSLAIYVGSTTEAIEVANMYAAEHLILQVAGPGQWVSSIRNAGSVFLGAWSPESLGDYASGTNHVLPTYGHAKVMGGVAVESFMKQITFQEATPMALRDVGPIVERLARLEGLSAHERAVSVRLSAITNEVSP